ncbi:MAG: DUF4920 domain-containing protein [bacterium]
MTGILLVIALFQPASQPAAPPADNTMGAAAVVHRGAAFTVADTVTLDAIAAAPDQFAGKTVKVSGKIGSVCKKKGCWMTINGEKVTSVARVVFKDYSFFAPLDSQGKLATLEGVVEAKVLDEAERKHLAEDAQKPVEEIPAAELRLIATALEVRAVGH